MGKMEGYLLTHVGGWHTACTGEVHRYTCALVRIVCGMFVEDGGG